MVEGGAKKTRRTATRRTATRKTTATRKPARKLEGGKKRKTTRTTVKRKTPVRSAKGKPRGAHHVGKYTGKFLKEVWEKAKKEKRKPTRTELRDAMQKGWALAREKGAV